MSIVNQHQHESATPHSTMQQMICNNQSNTNIIMKHNYTTNNPTPYTANHSINNRNNNHATQPYVHTCELHACEFCNVRLFQSSDPTKTALKCSRLLYWTYSSARHMIAKPCKHNKQPERDQKLMQAKLAPPYSIMLSSSSS